MNFTHLKRQYKAQCIQWDSTNTQDIINRVGGQLHTMGNAQYLMLRLPKQVCIVTMCVGDWLRIGENGVVKIYADKIFKERYENLVA